MPVIKSRLQEQSGDKFRRTIVDGKGFVNCARGGRGATKAVEKSGKSQGDTLYSEAIYPLRDLALNRKLSICAWSGLWL
jgi:hypothetical protein